MGTLRWFAPELFPSTQPDVQVSRCHTFATDIYAFALVCYEVSYDPFPFKKVVYIYLDVLWKTTL